MEFNLDYEKGLIDQLVHMKENIIKPKIDIHAASLSMEGFITDEPVLFKDIQKYALKPFKKGDTWGRLFLCGWFHLKGQIKKTKEPVYLKLDLSGEACLFDSTGTPIKGFTNGSSTFDKTHGEPGKTIYQINHLIGEDGQVDLWVEGGSNDLFGVLCEQGEMKTFELIYRDPKLSKLYDDLDTLITLIKVIDRNQEPYPTYLKTLLDLYYLVIYQEKEWLDRSLKMTEELLLTKTNNPLKVYAVGHAHIDLAWLWPIRETRRKAGRTLSNVIDLIEHHEHFIFGISQPQLLDWIKQDYPKLFEKIKHYVGLGRIELQGGMWVESDTNVAGEEALVRQMLYGIEYYKKEFGVRVKNLWLPDVFGYSGAMPQIIKKSGLDYFMTTKISWSLINKFPYHSYFWQGIDQSKVLVHMPPEGTYNSSASPRSIHLTDVNYKEKEIAPVALLVYGIGDGGGGPGYEHLARIDRQHNLCPLPKVEYADSNLYFKELEKYQDKLPTWQGELYLENHQGTYTSQANVKKYNRHMEHKLRSLEILLTMTNAWSYEIKEKLDDIWKEVLLYQFHDILPGSSIKRVYDECLARYLVLDQALDQIFETIDPTYQKGTSIDKALFNPLSYPIRWTEKSNHEYLSYEVGAFEMSRPKRVHKLENVEALKTIQTKHLIISINSKTGALDSIKDLRCMKEILSAPGNVLAVYQDKGDAWNISDHYRKQTPEVMTLKSQKMRRNQALVEIENLYEYKKSTLIETVLVDLETDAITFHHELDWKDVGYMLRTSFPLNIVFDEATFDIQFGEIKRSARNENRITSAQFEVPGQQWVSVTDGICGFSLINSSKYGFYVKDQVLDMNLLRSTNYPCHNGDIDKTTYRYQILSHKGNHEEAEIDQKAMIFNAFKPTFAKILPLEKVVSIDEPLIEVSAIKKGFHESYDVVRLYNKSNHMVSAEVIFNTKYQKAELSNLVEESLSTHSKKIVHFSPFEVKTFKLS